MNTDTVGKLIALLPLLLVLIAAVKTGNKALKASPMTDDDKAVRNEAVKAIAYIFAAASLLWWITPDFGVGLAVTWTILTIAFAVVVWLCVIELPSKFNSLHNRLWKHGRKTPVYSMSGEPVEHIRWARRIMLAVLVVVAIFSGIFAALSTTSSADNAAEAGPAAIAPADPTVGATNPAPATTTGTPSTSSTDAPAAPDTFKNECGGPDPKKVTTTKIDFKTGNKADGTPGLYVCHNGDWKTWDQANPNVAPPTEKVDLTYWVGVKMGKEGYGVVVINNTSYLFWTTAVTV